MRRNSILLFLIMAVAVTSCAGCASFRRKFIRHSKDADRKEDMSPVLEPVEYPRVVESSAQTYHEHYAMAKVYFSDAEGAMGQRDGNDKRAVYLLDQIRAHLDNMGSVLGETGRARVAEFIGRIQLLEKEYDKPAAMRRYDLLQSDLRKLERDVRRSLKPDVVKNDLKS